MKRDRDSKNVVKGSKKLLFRAPASILYSDRFLEIVISEVNAMKALLAA